MAVNISGLRRNIKNVACSFSPAQVKVREATSNDPWGPSSTVMSEVADLTYNVAAFSDVMQMIWKRLNDVGKNWRHVYKALVLLEYLLKTGCDKVIEESKMNVFIIKSLMDFQYLDDNKDHGVNVREKAKALVYLLKNDEYLKEERVKALKAKFNTTREKHQASRWMRTSQSMIETSLSQLEDDRPQTKGEEDLQLELALAMSRGDVAVDDDDEEDNLREDKPRSYRYLKAVNDSNVVNQSNYDSVEFKFVSHKSEEDIRGFSPRQEEDGVGKSSIFDLVDLEFPPPSSSTHENYPPNPSGPYEVSSHGAKKSMDPLYMSTPNLSVFGQSRALDPWIPQNSSPPLPNPRFDSIKNQGNMEHTVDDQGFFPTHRRVSKDESCVSGGAVGGQFDPWNSFAQGGKPMDDPFSSNSQQILANFDSIRQDIEGSSSVIDEQSDDPFVVKLDPSLTSPSLTELNALAASSSSKPGVGSILNEHQNLVDLDNWSPFGKNPFEQKTTNPFQPPKQSTPMNKLIPDIRSSPNPPSSSLDTFAFPVSQQPQQFLPQQQQIVLHQPVSQQHALQTQKPPGGNGLPEDNLFF